MEKIIYWGYWERHKMVHDGLLMVKKVAILRDIQLESYLVQMVELRYAPPTGCHLGMKIASLMDIQW